MPYDNGPRMTDIIDVSLVSDARRLLKKLLDERGIGYFLRKDAARPFALEPQRVDLVVRTAARLRAERQQVPHARAVEYARKQVRRELIRRVVAEMLQVGL